jgi:hypothetical protein
LHITHMNVKLTSQNFHRFWSMTSNTKSPNTCNFEGCPKLETPKFQHWQFFHFSSECELILPKTSRLKSSTISPSRVFQNPKFYMISMHVCGPEWISTHQCTSWPFCPPDGIHDSPFLFAADHCTFFFWFLLVFPWTWPHT